MTRELGTLVEGAFSNGNKAIKPVKDKGNDSVTRNGLNRHSGNLNADPRSWRQVIADRIEPNAFYPVRVNTEASYSGSIPPLSFQEAIVYKLKTGHWPYEAGDLTYVGSSGAIKTLMHGGALKALHEHGIIPKRFVTSSGAAFCSAYVVNGYDINAFLDFIIEVPDLVTFRKLSPLLSGLEAVVRAFDLLAETSVAPKIHAAGLFLKALGRGEEALTEDGLVVTNKGAADISKLVDRLKQIYRKKDGEYMKVSDLSNFHILALDIKDGLVALDRSYPDILLYEALSSAIAVPHYFPPGIFKPNGSGEVVILMDAVESGYFPLIRELIGKGGVVVGVDVGYNANFKNGKGVNLSGVTGYFDRYERISHHTVREITKARTRGETGLPPEILAEVGDVRNLEICYIAPHTINIPPYIFNFPMAKRNELIQQGYDTMLNYLKRFRTVTVNIPFRV